MVKRKKSSYEGTLKKYLRKYEPKANEKYNLQVTFGISESGDVIVLRTISFPLSHRAIGEQDL